MSKGADAAETADPFSVKIAESRTKLRRALLTTLVRVVAVAAFVAYADRIWRYAYDAGLEHNWPSLPHWASWLLLAAGLFLAVAAWLPLGRAWAALNNLYIHRRLAVSYRRYRSGELTTADYHRAVTRRPYRNPILGSALYAACPVCIALLAYLIFSRETLPLVKVSGIVAEKLARFAALTAAFPFVYLGMKLRAPKFEDKPGEKFVLYLRSFAADEADNFLSLWIFSGAHFGVATSELGLANNLKPIGKLVAVGKPGERLPTLGAARVYVGDEWREIVASLADRAVLTVMRIGDTDGIEWEVAEVAAKLPPERLLLAAPIGGTAERRRIYARFRERARPHLPSLPEAWEPNFEYLAFDSQRQPQGLATLTPILERFGIAVSEKDKQRHAARQMPRQSITELCSQNLRKHPIKTLGLTALFGLAATVMITQGKREELAPNTKVPLRQLRTRVSGTFTARDFDDLYRELARARPDDPADRQFLAAASYFADGLMGEKEFVLRLAARTGKGVLGRPEFREPIRNPMLDDAVKKTVGDILEQRVRDQARQELHKPDRKQ